MVAIHCYTINIYKPSKYGFTNITVVNQLADKQSMHDVQYY